jgi:hypothetical protein
MFTKSTVLALLSGILLSGCAHVGGLASRAVLKVDRIQATTPEPVAPTPKASSHPDMMIFHGSTGLPSPSNSP